MIANGVVLALIIVVSASILACLAYIISKIPKDDGDLSLVLQQTRYFAALGVAGAFKVAMETGEELGLLLDGADRKVLADQLYQQLPEVVKRVVAPNTFAGMVQDAYDEMLELYNEHLSNLQDVYRRIHT